MKTSMKALFAAALLLAMVLSFAYMSASGQTAGDSPGGAQTRLSASQPAAALLPGSLLSFDFPDMPVTWEEWIHPKHVPPRMSIFLPKNYDRKARHPLFVYLDAGSGDRGENPETARELTEEKDFVCVAMPLWKVRKNDDAVILREGDVKYMWPFIKQMLAKLDEVVPNIDENRRIIGGFSNGARTAAWLIDQSDGEAAKYFTAFCILEARCQVNHYELIKGKPLLFMFGTQGSTHATTREKADQVEQMKAAAEQGGAKVTLKWNEGVGHAFPDSGKKMVRDWLRGPALGKPGTDAK